MADDGRTYEELQNGEPYRGYGIPGDPDPDLGIRIPETLTYTGDVHEVRDWIEQTMEHHELPMDPGLMPQKVDNTLFVERSIDPHGEWRGTSVAQPGDIIHFDPKQGFSVQVDPAVTAKIAEQFDRANSAAPTWQAGVDRPDPLLDLPVTPADGWGPEHAIGAPPPEPRPPHAVVDGWGPEHAVGAPPPDVHHFTPLPDDRAWTADEIKTRERELAARPDSGPSFDGLPLDHPRTAGEMAQVNGARAKLSDQQQFVKAGAGQSAQNRPMKHRR